MWKASLLALFAACGSGEGRYGISLDDHTGHVTIEEVDAATADFLSVVGGRGHKLDGMRLHVERRPLPLNGDSGPCKVSPYDEHGMPAGTCAAGLSYLDADLIRIWLYTPCWGETAYIHELGHWFQLWRDHEDDPSHINPKWWGAGGVVERAYSVAVPKCP